MLSRTIVSRKAPPGIGQPSSNANGLAAGFPPSQNPCKFPTSRGPSGESVQNVLLAAVFSQWRGEYQFTAYSKDGKSRFSTIASKQA